MNPRAVTSILVCCIGIFSVHAQSEKKDSLRFKKEGEIYINQEAVKSIEFNFMRNRRLFNRNLEWTKENLGWNFGKIYQ